MNENISYKKVDCNCIYNSSGECIRFFNLCTSDSDSDDSIEECIKIKKDG